tara:strand:- start:1229 stop:1666 length:438 start_codon:yes stop_codon:yes gene_type:complete
MLDKLQSELITAMKAGDKSRTLGLRNIIGKIKAVQIDKGEILTSEESLKILKSSAKQLKESIKQYKQGNREDLAEKEIFELSILEKYLPEQLSEEEIRAKIKKIIEEMGAQSMQDMGKIMGAAMKNLGNLADGKIVQKIVTEELQ